MKSQFDKGRLNGFGFPEIHTQFLGLSFQLRIIDPELTGHAVEAVLLDLGGGQLPEPVGDGASPGLIPSPGFKMPLRFDKFWTRDWQHREFLLENT
jgi:hypothetical protein